MTPEAIMTLGQRALEITMLLAAPLLLAALVIGWSVFFRRPRRSTR
jgi:flagellar biosynthesis protein FliQ